MTTSTIDAASDQPGAITPVTQTPQRPHVIVGCRHCGVKNRLYRWALDDPPRRSRCGACEGLLLLADEPLEALDGAAYQHPWDREAMQAIHKIPGVDSLLRNLVSESFERAERLGHFSSFLHCGPQQLPRVYEIFCEAAARLDIGLVPDLFVSHQETMNAYTSGVQQPYVAISASLIEELRDDELMVVFAHELGHWQSDHVLYKVAARLLTTLADSLVTRVFGVGSLALKPLQMALLKWDRCSELTADRAALLAVRDPDVLVRTMMKLSGGSAYLAPQMRRDTFLAQVAQVKAMEKEHILNRLFLLWQELFRTHPMPIWRTAELLRWAEEGEFTTILAGDYPRRGAAAAMCCPICGVAYARDTNSCLACARDKAAASGDESDEDATSQLIDQVKAVGQDVMGGVQDAVQQGGQMLRDLFGGPDQDQDRRK